MRDWSATRLIAILLLLGIGGWGMAPVARGQATTGGTVHGTVYHGQSGDVLVRATVEVVGTGTSVTTGVDGDYSIHLAPGTYTLRFAYEGFSAQTEEITIAPGASIEKIAALNPVGQQLGEQIDVVAGANNDTIVAALEERKASTSLGEFVSRAEIASNPSSTTAGVVASVVGVSVGNNNVVVVRGLGDRYSTQMLNDATLPTPDPERRVVPMDLIPSSLLQNVRVLKTFTPDQPGEFSGGLLRLDTVEMPSSSSLSISSSLGFNTQTHGADFLSYPGFGRDWLGFGVGDRNLPEGFPSGLRLVRGDRFSPGYTPAELQSFGRSLSNTYSPVVEGARPNWSSNIAGAHRFGKLGFVGAFSLRNVYETVTDEERNVYATDASLEPRLITNFTFDTSARIARLGGAANFTYDINPNNRLYFKNFYSNQATDEVREYGGLSGEIGVPLRNYRLRYTAERIYSGQLSGRHTLGWLADTMLTWRWSYARSTLDDPALREVSYQFDEASDTFVLLPVSQSLAQLFSKMRENVREPGFDLSKFWFRSGVTINAKIGGAYTNRDRTFDARRFRFAPRGAYDGSASPEELLAPGNINPEQFEILETTRGTDHYEALHHITAGYAMADVLWGKWRFVGGARTERSIQRVSTFDPFAATTRIQQANLDNTDVLPSIGVAYQLTASMALRGGYSATVTRPQFRELSPYEFTDVFAGYTTFGNPELERTLLRNYDLRYEWFPTPGELFAVSYFYKDLENPIESVIGRGQFVRTFANAEGAINQGFEIEARKNLGFLTGALDAFSINTNYTFVDSSVTIADEFLGDLTSSERPLVGQSRHVFNLILMHQLKRWDLESRAYFNYTGDRIVDVGASGLPDIIEQGRPTLDLVFSKSFGGDDKPWSVELELENLLDRRNDYRIGDRIFRQFRDGREISIGLSYRFF